MDAFFQTILTTSFHGSVVILAVLALRLLLKKAPRKFICFLWMLAGIRLLLPIPIESAYSLQPAALELEIPARLIPVLQIIWVALAVGICLYSVGAYIHLRRQVSDAVKIPGGWESDKIETAFVLGFIKPKIYIPTGMSKATRQQILAHERTHLDKGDHWIKILGFVALAVHWFNPLVWVSYILLCKDIEMACDERVVQFMELDERKAYSAALLRCSTKQAHYAACPVAFGEISVKYRIKSILNYRKPSFWFSLLALLALLFVTICLLTNPQTTVQAPVDQEEPLRQMSREDPADFTAATFPPSAEENPDYGLTIAMQVDTVYGGTLTYQFTQDFPERMTVKQASLERWDGTAWQTVPMVSGQSLMSVDWELGLPMDRKSLETYREELDWSSNYGALDAGIYRLKQTIAHGDVTAVYNIPFQIFREQLPAEEEAAILRCQTALKAMTKGKYGSFNLLLSETGPDGNVYPVKSVADSGYQHYYVTNYVGQYTVSTQQVEKVYAPTMFDSWQKDFTLTENRRFYFPEGKSLISPEEVRFCSAWVDAQGRTCQGEDTFRFDDSGNLIYVNRMSQVQNDQGAPEQTWQRRVETLEGQPGVDYFSTYTCEDSFTAQEKSAWRIFFRIDDDLLSPAGGELWLGVDAIGVSNYKAGNTYWLEQRNDRGEWTRLKAEPFEVTWNPEPLGIHSQTQIFNIDWSGDYGRLAAGIYRMGMRFYSGEESIIQYAEFEILPEGEIMGGDGEAAMARVDKAIKTLLDSNFRMEEYMVDYNTGQQNQFHSQTYWKMGQQYGYQYFSETGEPLPGTVSTIDTYDPFGNAVNYDSWDSAYNSCYFPEGYSYIRDNEIQFISVYSNTAEREHILVYTYTFDDQDRIIRVNRSYLDDQAPWTYEIFYDSDAQLQAEIDRVAQLQP